jgi:hypothetical protein
VVRAGQRHGLAGNPLRLAVGGLADRQPARRDQAFNPNEGRPRPAPPGHFEGLGAPLAPLAEVTAVRPVAPERPGQPQRVRPVVLGSVVRIQGPAQRGPQVVVLGVEPAQPGHHVRARQRGRRPLGQVQVPRGVRPPGFPGLRAGLELLGAVFADRLQQVHPRPARRAARRGGDRHPDQVPGHQGGEAGHGVHPAHGLGRVEGAAAGEHAQLAEQPLLGRAQQFVAPGDRVPHGLLPVRQVVRAVHQLWQPAGQPGQQVTGRQQRKPGRGQLDGQRDAVEPAADLGHRLARRRVRRERCPSRVGPVREQLHGGGLGGVRVARAGERERGHRVLPPGPDAQRHPAGDQDDHAGAGLEQADHGIAGGQHVLEVVQHQQQPALAQGHCQQAGQRGRVPFVHAQLPGDGAEHQAGVAQRRQVGEHHPVTEVARHPPGHLDGQPGLAHPAGAGEDQQPRVAAAQQPDDGFGHAGPADQRRERPWQCHGGEGWSGAGRRGLAGLSGGKQAAPFGLIEVQGVGEQPDRIEPRSTVRVALQVADGLGADAGPLGQRLLGQAGRQPALPQQLTERRHGDSNGE